MARATTLLYPLARELLRMGHAPSRAHVAQQMDVHRGALQVWFDHLEHHRAIRTQRGALEVDRDRLLAVLTAHRVAGQRPAAPFQTGLDVQEASQQLREADVPHAFCLFTAANLLAFYEERQEMELYVAAADRARARAALEGTGTRTVRPFIENIQALETGRSADTDITSPLLTLADLRAHPEGGAHASFLLEHRIRRGWQ